MNELENASYCKPLVGRAVLSVQKKDLSWFFEFGDGISVVTESLWRFMNADRIVVTSEDHGHPFGRPSPVDAAERIRVGVSSNAVVAASITPVTSDLLLDFGDTLLLQFLQTSCGYESWRLFAGTSETICGGGGDVVHFPSSN